MAKTIFRVLKNCSKDAVASNSVVYKKLVELMVQGGITNSEVEQFISRNYLLSVGDLTKKWNAAHTKQKIGMTFRGQISTLSSKYYKLFGTDAGTFEEALLSGDENNTTVVRVLKILTAIGVESDPLVSRFDYTIRDYLGDYETDKTYEVAECEEELKLLKMLDKQNLEAVFSRVSKDKLAYIFQMLRADLIQSEVVEFERKDRHSRQTIKKEDGSVAVRRVLSPMINEMKMELCLRFNAAKAMRLTVVKPVGKIEAADSQITRTDYGGEAGKNTSGVGSQAVVQKENDSLAKPSDNPFGLDITKEMADLIEKRLKAKRKSEELGDTDFSKIDIYKEYLHSLTMDTPLDDLYKWLRSVNAVFLGMALDELKGGN